MQQYYLTMITISVMDQYISLRKTTDYLAISLIVIAFYMLIVPFAPAVGWWIKHDTPLASLAAQPAVENIPAENTLYIPALDIRQPIHEGQGLETVDKGIWRRPQTSTPDQGSNTVLVGHRFVYQSAGVFYHLDKLKMGDKITVYWQEKKYEYEVSSLRETSPYDKDVEAPSSEPTLTLYTCTPLLTAENRLIIKAKLISQK
jgi:LPXTG-site transpeptidase (sortase) family protein